MEIRVEMGQARNTINRGHEVYQNLVKHTDQEIQKKDQEILSLKQRLDHQNQIQNQFLIQ